MPPNSEPVPLFPGSLADAKLAVVAGFAASPEWQDRVGALGDSQFVEFLYTNLLGRASDSGGYGFHLDNLQSGVVTRESLIVQFLDSPEAVAIYANHTYVVMAYLSLLDRAAEPAGFVYHMTTLESGASDPVAFLIGFIYAPEYINRLALRGCGWTAPLPATTRTVGLRAYHDHTTIQAALDAASAGDEIVVFRGLYVENIDFGGKNLILRSTDPENDGAVSGTVIDGGYRDPVVTFAGTEDPTCALSGFTIQHGKGRLYYAEFDPVLGRFESEYGGGGIFGDDCRATIERNVITDNYSYLKTLPGPQALAITDGFGGGIWRCDGLISENSIINNGSYTAGGALGFCDGTIVHNRIEGNFAEKGGGLFLCDGLIAYNDIERNAAVRIISDNVGGGGLYFCNGDILYNNISGNSSEDSGGGLAACDGSIVGNQISSNVAQNKGGGGVGCVGFISQNIIGSNRARIGGGLYNCFALIQNSLFYDNQAEQGGAIANSLHPNRFSTIMNNVIYWNIAQSDNQDAAGSGIYSRNASDIIINTIIWGNYGTAEYQFDALSTPTFSCIQDWALGGEGNIALDPRFVDALNGDFHLSADSPCIDTGGMVTLAIDFDGNPRPLDGDGQGAGTTGDGSDFDIGAFEFSW